MLYATEGREASVLAAFRRDLEAHGGEADRVTDFCLEMSVAYLKGLAEQFPEAEASFDKFHVMKMLNRAVDEVRRQEQKGRHSLIQAAKASGYRSTRNLIVMTYLFGGKLELPLYRSASASGRGRGRPVQ